jgi:hypothetical protein
LLRSARKDEKKRSQRQKKTLAKMKKREGVNWRWYHKIMRRLLTQFSFCLVIGLLFSSPLMLGAWAPGEPIVPCGQRNASSEIKWCVFDDVIKLADNLIDFFIWVSIPISAILFLFAGYLYTTAASSEQNISRAHGIFSKLAVGMIIVLGGYYIIKLIFTVLAPEYSPFA